MARALIILAMAVLLSACQSDSKRLDSAATATGQASAVTPRPITPESCTAKIERVYPKIGEKARWTQKRWEIVADNRDRLADNCGAALDDYWNAVDQITGGKVNG